MGYSAGNIICVMFLIVQTLLLNGFGEAFGVLANIFKTNNLFISYCPNVRNTGTFEIAGYIQYDTNASYDTDTTYDRNYANRFHFENTTYDTYTKYDTDDTYDYYENEYTCTGRDILFANVGVAANIFWAIFVFSGACLLDPIGLFRLRIIVFVVSFMGLVSFALVSLYEPAIWVALPFVQGGGSLSLMLNQFHVRALPGIQFTLMMLLSGCFHLSSSIPVILSFLHFQYHIPMNALFTTLAVIYTLISLTIILIWTPDDLPQTLPSSYSLWNESVTWKRSWDKQRKTSFLLPLWIFKTPRFYIMFLGSSLYAFRIFSFKIWWTFGWPQWVAGPDFGIRVNELVGYWSNDLVMIFVSIIPGVVIDLCRKLLKDDFNGTRVGLIIITTTTFGGLILQR